MENKFLTDKDWDIVISYIKDGEQGDKGGFELWLAENESRKLLYEELKVLLSASSRRETIDGNLKTRVWESIQYEIKNKNVKLGHRKLFYYVAAALLPFIFLYVGYLLGDSRPSETVIPLGYSQLSDLDAVGAQDSYSVKLIMSDGKVLNLSKELSITDENGVLITNNPNKEISFVGSSSKNTQKINTIIVPRGREYSVKLSDGTKVCLNSGSVLQFYSSMRSDKREVYLSGEAYFKVMSNESVPFAVNMKSGKIIVHGTTFNVDAYNADKEVKTMLVEGKVNFSSMKGCRYEMKPLELLVYSGSKDTYTVEKDVDVSLYTSWVDGVYRFKNQSLGDIMARLLRWYHYDIVYMDESVKRLRFTGYAEKEQPIQDFLELLSNVKNISYEVKNGVIFLSMRN